MAFSSTTILLFLTKHYSTVFLTNLTSLAINSFMNSIAIVSHDLIINGNHVHSLV